MDRTVSVADRDGGPMTEDSLAGQLFFSRLPGPARFIILRHGQSEGNARKIMQGRLDLPLDEAGRGQARAAAAWLVREGVDAVLSSPLARAAETAGILAAAARLGPPALAPCLSEVDIGPFTGLSFREAGERYPEYARRFERESWDGVPGAEPSDLLYPRAMEAWRLLRARAEGGSRAIVAVSHGGFIQWLLRATFGCRTWMPLFPTGNCGIFELRVEPKGAGEPAYMIWKRLDWRIPSAHPSLDQLF